ncbi:MAG: hypothetical protein ACPG05_01555 [Bdellovibrionales bacterium]
MIHCSCTGLNTGILKEAIDSGATRLAEVYNLAKEKNGESSRCSLPEQRTTCTIGLAKAWAELSPDNVPPSVQKVIDKAEKKKGACGNDCASCPSKNLTDGVVGIFDPKASETVNIPISFSCETGVTRDAEGVQIAPQKLIMKG